MRIVKIAAMVRTIAQPRMGIQTAPKEPHVNSVPKKNTEDGSSKGGAGIDVLYEYVGSVAREKVTDNASAYTGEHSDEYGEENVAAEACVNGDSCAAYCEDTETGGVTYEHNKLVYPVVLGNFVTYRKNENYYRYGDGEQCVGGITERSGRRNAEYKVADDTAAYCGGKTEDTYAENIHVLFKAGDSAGNGEGYRTDYLKNQNKKSHKVPPIKKVHLAVSAKCTPRIYLQRAVQNQSFYLRVLPLR